MATTTNQIREVPLRTQHLVVGWIALLPMLFICVNGTLTTETGSIELRKTATVAGALSYRVPATVMAVLCLGLAAWKYGAVLKKARRVKPLIFLTLAAPLSAIWSDNPLHSLSEGILLIALTAFALFVASVFSEERQMELVVLAAGIVLTVSILLAVGVPSVGTMPESGAWRGLFGQKNNCAGTCLFLLLPAVHWKTHGIFERALRWVVILEALLLIFMSQSRTGWGLAVAMILLSGTLALLRHMRSREAAAVVATLAMMALVILYAGYQYGPQILAFIGKDSTMSQRTIIWQMVSESLMKRPLLGYGFNAFWGGTAGESINVILVTHWMQAQSQNGFLDVWLQLGAFGITLLAACLLQPARRAINNFRAAGATQLWIELMICTLLFNIGESTLLGSHSLSWFLFIVASAGLSRASAAKASAEHHA
jgi:O-antigen ligase